jgi:hypothetical protein
MAEGKVPQSRHVVWSQGRTRLTCLSHMPVTTRALSDFTAFTVLLLLRLPKYAEGVAGWPGATLSWQQQKPRVIPEPTGCPMSLVLTANRVGVGAPPEMV